MRTAYFVLLLSAFSTSAFDRVSAISDLEVVQHLRTDRQTSRHLETVHSDDKELGTEEEGVLESRKDEERGRAESVGNWVRTHLRRKSNGAKAPEEATGGALNRAKAMNRDAEVYSKVTNASDNVYTLSALAIVLIGLVVYFSLTTGHK